jgi:3,4-dihydroxy 2-butanone 4-phosphate synthase/GTP cyclohydrolase II
VRASSHHRAAELRLPPMVSAHRPAAQPYTVTVDAAQNITTGISAHDRAHTITLLGSATTTASMLSRPGHTVPICAADGGMLSAPGRVHAALDLVALGGLSSAAYLGTIVSEQSPTRMASGPELAAFAAAHGLPVVTVQDVGEQLRNRLTQNGTAECRALLTPTAGPAPQFFQDGPDSTANLALRFGTQQLGGRVDLAVMRECPWDRLFGAAYCDCRARRAAAISALQIDGGMFVYLRCADTRAHLTRTGASLAWSVPGWACAQDKGSRALTDAELDVVQSLRVELGIDSFGSVQVAGSRHSSDAVRLVAPLRGFVHTAV